MALLDTTGTATALLCTYLLPVVDAVKESNTSMQNTDLLGPKSIAAHGPQLNDSEEKD